MIAAQLSDHKLMLPFTHNHLDITTGVQLALGRSEQVTRHSRLSRIRPRLRNEIVGNPKYIDFWRFQGAFCPYFPNCGHNSPIIVSSCLRAIQRFASANSVSTCAVFFARPLKRTFTNPNWRVDCRRRTAYCPLCFRNDRPPSTPTYFRNQWAAAWLTHCPVHRTPLMHWKLARNNDRYIAIVPGNGGDPSLLERKVYWTLERDIRLIDSFEQECDRRSSMLKEAWDGQLAFEEKVGTLVEEHRAMTLDDSWMGRVEIGDPRVIRELADVVLSTFGRSARQGRFPGCGEPEPRPTRTPATRRHHSAWPGCRWSSVVPCCGS